MALKEHSFGILGYTAVGAIGGASAATFTNLRHHGRQRSGDLEQPTMAEQVVWEMLCRRGGRRNCDDDRWPDQARFGSHEELTNRQIACRQPT